MPFKISQLTPNAASTISYVTLGKAAIHATGGDAGVAALLEHGSPHLAHLLADSCSVNPIGILGAAINVAMIAGGASPRSRDRISRVIKEGVFRHAVHAGGIGAIVGGAAYVYYLATEDSRRKEQYRFRRNRLMQTVAIVTPTQQLLEMAMKMVAVLASAREPFIAGIKGKKFVVEGLSDRDCDVQAEAAVIQSNEELSFNHEDIPAIHGGCYGKTNLYAGSLGTKDDRMCQAVIFNAEEKQWMIAYRLMDYNDVLNWDNIAELTASKQATKNKNALVGMKLSDVNNETKVHCGPIGNESCLWGAKVQSL